MGADANRSQSRQGAPVHDDELPTEDAAPWLTARRAFWLGEVTTWIIDTVVALRAGAITRIEPVRERPWGAVLRVTTADQTMFFKAEGLGSRHEPAVLARLAGRWSSLVPDVLAVESARSWFLMADHGRPMWDVLDGPAQVALFEWLLPLYAELQASTVPSVESWVHMGAPDRRMHVLPELLDRLLAGEMWGGRLPIDHHQRQALDAVLPRFRLVCDELSAASFAATLDHGDLHGGNVLIDGSGRRLADWGDSCVTHPFSSLFVTYQLAITRLGPSDRAAAILRLRDSYLEAWTAAGPPKSLRRSFTLAVWVAHVSRALDFVHMLEGSTQELTTEWQENIVQLLRRWQQTQTLLNQDQELLFAIQP